ncbi:alpha-glucuronidase family glycosyl hydrolase [Actomonas aquatica]|uniref:Xylan alpha-1,2-glucuronidase n=1 Tax=Actomonas aquatica TaxID=2866162 RepID=A0ABZ1C3G1_9BACT|nr:alpha-glucuronidase family glycosyl hydrolase [Opitutus sp. WL0086]WRQ85892.1 alpha-glucuronidase family glycosyl hydrolase [Opitutus sp. WL0086]
MKRYLLAALLAGVGATSVMAEDGYRLWLRYDRVESRETRSDYRGAVEAIVVQTPTGEASPTIDALKAELARGLDGLIGRDPTVHLVAGETRDDLGADGYALTNVTVDGDDAVRITANSDAGALYGAFALLRKMQLRESLDALDEVSVPKIDRRLLNHWDNLNRFVERGYAGFSLWEWNYLPDILSPRYTDYARALASVGLNGTVVTNVNANALVLTPEYLTKVKALADVFRPWGIRIYLTARFSAPMEIGGLETADPLDPAVQAWWDAKVAEIYEHIPDFGGFLVKANSEGQPGPWEYGRDHADGANLLAKPLAAAGRDGIVMWRAFVYAFEDTTDRVKQAYNQFVPLDGKFADNVLVQIKNGPLDFMPREAFSPLFGATPQTNQMVELQITQEYLGASIQLAYLGTMWEEVLDQDTYVAGEGSTIGKVVDGSLFNHPVSAIAGVANTGDDRNWTGHPLAQANWYAYGRLAWDHELGARDIATEWTGLTFDADEEASTQIVDLLMGSRETVVNYSMPLGLHHIMERGHHYGPGPWVTGGRADWTSPYYHQADEVGLGANRIASGTNAIEQYAPELQEQWGQLANVPDELLLWFHHVPWDYEMRSGRTLWNELALRYQQGVDEVRAMRATWADLRGGIDEERWDAVRQRLALQEKDAIEWRDACLLYFQQFSQRPLPEGVEAPAYDLQHYIDVDRRFFPGHPGDY